MDKIAVLIPCYNEEQTIGKVVKDFKRELPEAAIYVYDNNSKDKTALIAKENGAIVKKEYKQGKGNVIRRMFREIDAEAYIMVDGDDTYPAENAREMVDMIFNHNADMVVGDRLSSTYFVENKRPFHNFGNSIVRLSINKLFKTDIKDIMTGYRAFSYQFVKTFPVLSNGFEIETEMTIHAADKNLQVDNVIVNYRDRPEGSESKLNTISDGTKVLFKILSLYKTYKPLAFFSILSFIFFVMASILFGPVMVEYIKTGLVPKFPTLIVSWFLFSFSLQSMFSGFLLQNISTKNKHDFEMNYINKDIDFKKLKKEA